MEVVSRGNMGNTTDHEDRGHHLAQPAQVQALHHPAVVGADHILNIDIT